MSSPAVHREHQLLRISFGVNSGIDIGVVWQISHAIPTRSCRCFVCPPALRPSSLLAAQPRLAAATAIPTATAMLVADGSRSVRSS